MIRGLFIALLFAAVSFGSIARAESVRYLGKPLDSLREFQRLIQGAKSSIDIATFIFEPCHASTRLLMQALKERADRGVRVRLLLDAFQQDGGEKQNLINEAASSGIELRFYAESLTDGINARMHIKFMQVDKTTVLTGGRNIADPYFGLSSEINYLDRDVSITGTAGAQAAQYFNELWASNHTSRPNTWPAAPVAWTSLCEDGATLNQRISDLRGLLATEGQASWAQVPVRSCPQATFRTDNPDFRDLRYGLDQYDMNSVRIEHKRATKDVMTFMMSSTSRLQMENYAYMPITQLSAVFASLRDRRVPVEVLSNADMEEGPQWFRDMEEALIQMLFKQDNVGSQNIRLISSKGALTAAHRLTPANAPFFLHGKTAVRDNRDVLVSSFNLDARSANINLESAVVIPNCPDLARDVQAGYNQVRSMDDADATSGDIPPKEDPGPLALFMARINAYLL